MNITSHYLECVFNKTKFESMVNNAANKLDDFDHKTPFDSIAFTGASGAALAFPLSIALEKSLICVRKRRSGSHSPYEVEGNCGSKSYIIVDDFTETGETIDRITSALKHFCNSTPAGIYLYRPTYSDRSKSEFTVNDNLTIPMVKC